MNLQDELTPEFLSWVLGEYVIVFMVNTDENSIAYRTHREEDSTYQDEAENLDTLTRLCLEKIESKGYIYNLFNSTSVQGYVMIIDDHKVIGKSMLDVAIKQAKHVMEKAK